MHGSYTNKDTVLTMFNTKGTENPNYSVQIKGNAM